jgi:LCP family protein required for cell wall assembly
VRRALGLTGWVLRILPVVVVLLVAVPGSAVRPTSIALTTVQHAEGYDAGGDVVWVLVLGSDAPPGTSIVEGDTDAIQLLGIDAGTGAAAAIGIPRDTYVDLGGEKGRINVALRTAKGDPALVAGAVADLVGISPDFVLVTGGQGFEAMIDTLGGVTVDSPVAFDTDDGGMHVVQGPNHFDGEQALDFATTRRAFAGPGDFVRSANHQALLLGLLNQLQARDDRQGFVEAMALASLDGIDTDASPLDLYRLLNALTAVDPAQAKGCILVGEESQDPVGNFIVLPDTVLGHQLGEDAVDDATFDQGCEVSP